MLNGNTLWTDHFSYKMKKTSFLGVSYDTYDEDYINAYEILKRHAETDPNKCFAHAGMMSITFSELQHSVDLCAELLKTEYSIKAGDWVATQMFNSIEYVVLFLSLQKLSAVFVPVPSKYSASEVQFILVDAEIKLYVIDKKFESNYFGHTYLCSEKILLQNQKKSLKENAGKELHEEKEDSNAEALAIVMFTSGTTGKSKAAKIYNFNAFHAARSYQKIFNLNDDSKTVLAIPMYNITGLIGILLPILLAKGELFIEPLYVPETILSLINDRAIDYFHGSPTVFITIIDAARKMNIKALSLKTIACGSSNMPIQDIAMLESIFPNAEFRPIYGLTESTSPGTIMPEHTLNSSFLGSAGMPIPGFKIKICDDEGRENHDGKEGTIWITGTNVIHEYFPENFDLIDREHWLNTGDIGKIVENYLYIVDRKKDVINRGGEKIYSFEVEKLIYDLKHLNIKEVALVGVLDHKYGEVPVAVISTFDQSKPDFNEIKEYLATHLAKFKRPVSYLLLTELPKNNNGKIDKKQIREIATAAILKGAGIE